ncbi:MAG: RNA-protein complex protein Nop10 [Thermoplasmata archaeon]
MNDARLHRCPECGRYTLASRCPACGAATRTPHPARYSPHDRFGKYRRMLLASATGGEGTASAPGEGGSGA